MENFIPIKTARISESIEEQIGSAIFSERLKPGKRLPSENALSKIFDTSRTTVREALRALEKEGLLTIKQGVKGGPYVRELNASPVIRYFSHMLKFNKVTLDNLTEARMVVEPEIAKLAALRSTRNDIKRMERALRQLGQAVTEKRRSTATNISFHRIIGEACQNPILFFLNDAFLNLLQENLSRLSIDLENNRILLQQHFQIFEAIRDRNPEQAYAELRNHILTVKKVMKPKHNEKREDLKTTSRTDNVP